MSKVRMLSYNTKRIILDIYTLFLGSTFQSIFKLIVHTSTRVASDIHNLLLMYIQYIPR